MYSRILVATDGSELADKGVEAGLALARALAARVVLVTASEPWQDIYPGDPNGMALSSELRDDYRKSKQADCERILAQAQKKGPVIGNKAGKRKAWCGDGRHKAVNTQKEKPTLALCFAR